jgi:hypothetical protein
MCAKLSVNQLAGESPVRGKSFGSRYRVLRGLSRGNLRSVHRNHAGRNAISVKGLSPDKPYVLWWPSKYAVAKAAPVGYRPAGTTGVLDHGMYGKLIQELGRSAKDRLIAESQWQGVMTKSVMMSIAEVRRLRSSEEVG